MRYLGDFVVNSIVYIPFHTFDANGASVTISNFAVGDIAVYKNGGMTERGSTSGYTLLDTDGIDLDGITGIHGISIDLANNADAGFFASGNDYLVRVGPITINAQTVNFVAATFSIENRNMGLRAYGRGVVGSASTTTSVVTSSIVPAATVADQFKGRILIFDKNTTTTNLRGQATDIVSNTSGGVLTVSALTTAPVSGDTFGIH